MLITFIAAHFDAAEARGCDNASPAAGSTALRLATSRDGLLPR